MGQTGSGKRCGVGKNCEVDLAVVEEHDHQRDDHRQRGEDLVDDVEVLDPQLLVANWRELLHKGLLLMGKAW